MDSIISEPYYTGTVLPKRLQDKGHFGARTHHCYFGNPVILSSVIKEMVTYEFEIRINSETDNEGIC